MIDLARAIAAAQYERLLPWATAMIPLPKQRLWIASKAKQKFLIGGQRSSKSEAGACDLVLEVLGVKGLLYPGFPADGVGVDAWAVALSSLKFRDTIQPKLEKMLGGSVHRGGYIRRFYEADALYEISNGRTIQLMSCEAGFDKFQSVAIGKVWCDEVPPEPVYKQLVVRVSEQQGSLGITATPTRGTGWLGAEKYEEWAEGTQGETREHKGKLFVFMDTSENRYIPPSVVSDLEDTYRDPDELAMAKGGRFVSLSGRVFREFDFERHVVHPKDGLLDLRWRGKVPWPLPAEWPRYRGFDWGIRSPCPCVWIAQDPVERVFVVYRELYLSETSVQEICRRVLSLTGDESISGDFLDPSCWNRKGADGAGEWLDTSQEYINAGIPVVKGNNSWEQGIQRIRDLFRDDHLFLLRDCVNGIREVRRYEWPAMKQGESGRLVQAPEVRSRNHDHFLDGMRYAIMGTTDYESGKDQQGIRDGSGTGFRSDADADDPRRYMEVELEYQQDGRILTVPRVRRGEKPDRGLRFAGGAGLR